MSDTEAVTVLRDQAEPRGEEPFSCLATVIVCASCRDESGSDAHPRAGELLARDTEAAAHGRVGVATVECLGNCRRRLSAALVLPGAWTYVFGDLSPSSGADLIAGAELLAAARDGILPWRGRPDCLKRGLVARIPPLARLKVSA